METTTHSSPTLSAPAPEPPPVGVPAGVACKACGYDLAGLRPELNCPECGFPIEESLSDDQLRNSSPEYLSALYLGVRLVLNGILVSILLTFAAIGLTFALQGGTPQWIESAISAAHLLVSGAVFYGWWLLSSPDPAFVGRRGGQTPRKLVRIGVGVQAGASLVNFALALVSTGAGGNFAMVVVSLSFVVSLMSFAAFAVAYFASMLYIRWLAPRIPNPNAFKRAKTLMWLGPLLATFGLVIIGLGPLIALVLYWNMLDWVRKDLKRIRAERRAGVPEAASGSMA